MRILQKVNKMYRELKENFSVEKNCLNAQNVTLEITIKVEEILT